MHKHHSHHSSKSAKSTGGTDRKEDLLDFEKIGKMPEKAQSVIHGMDKEAMKSARNNTPEYQLLQIINQIREKSQFPPLKFKSSLKEFALDKAIGKNVQPETNGLFTIVSTMHFVDVYNGESLEELAKKWFFDTNKLQVILATGTMANITFFSGDDKITRVVLLVVSTFS